MIFASIYINRRNSVIRLVHVKMNPPDRDGQMINLALRNAMSLVVISLLNQSFQIVSTSVGSPPPFGTFSDVAIWNFLAGPQNLGKIRSLHVFKRILEISSFTLGLGLSVGIGANIRLNVDA